MRGSLKTGLFITALFFLTARFLYAANDKLIWKDVYKGVKYSFYETVVENKTVRFHVVCIDLTQSGIKITTSPLPDEFIQTSKFAKKIGAQIAINGGFWNFFNIFPKPLGLYVFEGNKYERCQDGKQYGFLAVTKEGKPWICAPNENFIFSPNKAYMAISGYPMIVREGKVYNYGKIGYIGFKHPRTAVGIDKSGKKLFLAVSDVRKKDNAGVGLRALGELMVKIGVWDGLNLDGGGSSNLYIEKRGGIVNRPSDEKERYVFNCLAIVIQ
jgi:exopolysaccharide biosynthesis protein